MFTDEEINRIRNDKFSKHESERMRQENTKRNVKLIYKHLIEMPNAFLNVGVAVSVLIKQSQNILGFTRSDNVYGWCVAEYCDYDSGDKKYYLGNDGKVYACGSSSSVSETISVEVLAEKLAYSSRLYGLPPEDLHIAMIGTLRGEIIKL